MLVDTSPGFSSSLSHFFASSWPNLLFPQPPKLSAPFDVATGCTLSRWALKSYFFFNSFFKVSAAFPLDFAQFRAPVNSQKLYAIRPFFSYSLLPPNSLEILTQPPSPSPFFPDLSKRFFSLTPSLRQTAFPHELECQVPGFDLFPPGQGHLSFCHPCGGVEMSGFFFPLCFPLSSSIHPQLVTRVRHFLLRCWVFVLRLAPLCHAGSRSTHLHEFKVSGKMIPFFTTTLCYSDSL